MAPAKVAVRVAGRRLNLQEPQWRCVVLGVLLFLFTEAVIAALSTYQAEKKNEFFSYRERTNVVY